LDTFVFVMPLLPGKAEVDRQMLERVTAPGPDRDAYVAARRSQGVAREAIWHQNTPMGTLAIVLLEAEDIASSFGKIATSDEPFAQQFREFVKEVHGVDLAKDPPPEVSLISDTRF
jgi:hypothetical protein